MEYAISNNSVSQLKEKLIAGMEGEVLRFLLEVNDHANFTWLTNKTKPQLKSVLKSVRVQKYRIRDSFSSAVDSLELKQFRSPGEIITSIKNEPGKLFIVEDLRYLLRNFVFDPIFASNSIKDAIKTYTRALIRTNQRQSKYLIRSDLKRKLRYFRKEFTQDKQLIMDLEPPDETFSEIMWKYHPLPMPELQSLFASNKIIKGYSTTAAFYVDNKNRMRYKPSFANSNDLVLDHLMVSSINQNWIFCQPDPDNSRNVIPFEVSYDQLKEMIN